MKILYVIGLLIFSLGASDCSKKVKEDKEVWAQAGNDLTVLMDGSKLVEGCGTQLQSGLLFCRVHQRQSAESEIYLVGPPAKCNRDDSCVFFKIFFPNGEPALEKALPEDSTSVAIPWKELIKRDSFELNDRGWWPVIRTIHWIDEEDRDRKTVDEGLIYLRVLRNDYKALHESPDNEYFVWHHVYNGIDVKMTSGGRTYVGKN